MLYSVIAGLLIGIGALSLFLLAERLGAFQSSDRLPGDATDLDGVIDIYPPQPLPDFALVNQHGESTRLSDLRGKLALLTFGFTHCPDICPLTLDELGALRDMLGDMASQASFVFISVDGARDSPRVLRDYFAFRKLDGILGLTGQEAAVRQAGAPLGLSFEVSGNGEAGYLINHTVGYFLLDRDGRWIKRYHFGIPPATIAEDLRALLSS